jgi:hypothetical protein
MSTSRNEVAKTLAALDKIEDILDEYQSWLREERSRYAQALRTGDWQAYRDWLKETQD